MNLAAAGLAALSIGVTGAPAAPTAPAPCPGAGDPPAASAASVARVRATVLCLLNRERRAHHARGLRAERHLRIAAQRYARALGPSAPLVHQRPGGPSPAQRLARAGYARGDAGAFTFAETLGRSSGSSATPAQRVADWLTGDGRALLLSRRFRDAGVGVAVTGGKATFVLELAARVR